MLFCFLTIFYLTGQNANNWISNQRHTVSNTALPRPGVAKSLVMISIHAKKLNLTFVLNFSIDKNFNTFLVNKLRFNIECTNISFVNIIKCRSHLSMCSLPLVIKISFVIYVTVSQNCQSSFRRIVFKIHSCTY